MKGAGAYTSKLYFGKLKQALVIKWLYLLHWLTGRRLNLAFISEPESVIFSKGYFTLHWKVTGCHQIGVNGVMLPGNASLIHLDPIKQQGPLVLSFYGCKETIVKRYTMSPIHIRTKQLGHTLLQEPKLRQWEQPACLEEKLSAVHLPSVSLSSSLQFRVQPDTVTIHESLLQVELDTCEIPEYNP